MDAGELGNVPGMEGMAKMVLGGATECTLGGLCFSGVMKEVWVGGGDGGGGGIDVPATNDSERNDGSPGSWKGDLCIESFLTGGDIILDIVGGGINHRLKRTRKRRWKRTYEGRPGGKEKEGERERGKSMMFENRTYMHTKGKQVSVRSKEKKKD